MEEKLWKIPFIASLFLTIGLFNLPIGYYTLLRIIVFIIGLGCTLIPVRDDGSFSYYNVFAGILAILFNPIFPIYLHDKDAWKWLDLLAAVFFVVYALKQKHLSENSSKDHLS